MVYSLLAITNVLSKHSIRLQAGVTYLVTVLEECNPQHLHVVAAVVHLAVVS